METLDDIVKEFLVESYENLDRLDQDFVRLEKSPADRETLGSIFRVLHTLKGSAGLFGFKRLEMLGHAGEHLLGRLRDGRLALNADMVNALLADADTIRGILRHIESTHAEVAGDDQQLIETLHLLADGKPAPARAAVAPSAAPKSAVPAEAPVLDELAREFLLETQDNLVVLMRNLSKLEDAPADREMISAVFRTLHTLRGNSSFFGFAKLEQVAHAAEDLLARLRSGELTLTLEMTEMLHEMVEAVRELLAAIESTGRETSRDYRDLVACLAQLSGVTHAPPSRAQHTAAGQFRRAPAMEEPPSPVAAPVVVSLTPAAGKPTAGEPRAPDLTESTVRVDVGLLDTLMTLVGELVLARNRLLPFAADHAQTAFVAATQRLDAVTTELQERVMKTRMQPISSIWSKFPRLVRDLARECGKQVNLELEGQGTELDRTLIEAIKDPLTHIIRNSVDHGIETPEARGQAGKPPAGRLVLRAFHEGGLVIVEITDDGRGIDLARVREKAVQQGLLSAEQAARLNEREAMDLIFLPGFSTAEKTTNVSGRGGGRDVVKTNLEGIGGTLDIRSRVGEGTTIRLKVPLTLAIIPALLVSCGGERYAIPQTSLLELIRLEQGASAIELVYGAPVCRLRGKLLPLAFLTRELQLQPATAMPADGPVNIVVVQAEGHRFGVVVDEIHDTEEIVVKPLGRLLKGVPCFAGATILGDGRVALILDVVGLALHSGVVAQIREKPLAGETPVAAAAENAQTLLLFDLGAEERMAVPLELVARLEKFPRARLERTGGQEVVQYQGRILPLVRVADYVTGCPRPPEEADSALEVVVHSAQGWSVGLIVGRIHDIVREPVTLQASPGRRGLLGSAIVQRHVTGVLDVAGILAEARPALAQPERLPAS